MAPPDPPFDPSRAGSDNDPESQLPSVLARVLAFASILVGGAAGAMIGWSFAQIGGFEGAAAGAVTMASGLLGAGGVAVVAVLTLRAFGEWETIRSADRCPEARARGRR